MRTPPLGPPAKLHAPDETLKGVFGGRCNRTACQNPPADWYNHGMGSRWADPKSAANCYYCADCAREINLWSTLDGPGPLCYSPTDPRHPWYSPATQS